MHLNSAKAEGWLTKIGNERSAWRTSVCVPSEATSFRMCKPLFASDVPGILRVSLETCNVGRHCESHGLNATKLLDKL